jgi:hypothetical protein
VPLPWILEVTTISFAPGLTDTGVVPVISVALTNVRLPTSLPPIVTLVTLLKLLPVIVTLVPPAIGPVAGLTAVTVTDGGGGLGAPLSLQAKPPTSRIRNAGSRAAEGIHPLKAR